MITVNHLAFEDTNAVLSAVGFKILHGAQVNVRGVVPLVGQRGRHRHAPFQAQVGADFPVAEVGESDNRFATDADHFVEYLVRAQHRLQGLGHHHVIKAVILEIAQPAVQILLQHIHALFKTGGQVVLVDFQAIAGGLLVRFQVGQQGAVAATQIQQGCVVGNPVAD